MINQLNNNTMTQVIEDENKTTSSNNFKSPEVSDSLMVMNYQELLDADIKPREYIVYPILQEGGLAMLYAKRGVGKTFVSLELALAVANGSDMFEGKWKAVKPMKVLYIDGEMQLDKMRDRIKAIGERTNGMFLRENFHLINQEMQENGIPDLSTKEGQEKIEKCITEGTKLLILDSLSSLCRSGRENESESWVVIQDWLLSLRRRGIAVLIVHHAGKNGDQRGNSKKEDNLDTVINLKETTNTKKQEGTKFIVSYEKSRHFYGDETESFEVYLTENGFVVEDSEFEVFQTLLELKKQGYSQREMAKEIGSSASTVNTILQKYRDK